VLLILLYQGFSLIIIIQIIGMAAKVMKKARKKFRFFLVELNKAVTIPIVAGMPMKINAANNTSMNKDGPPAFIIPPA
jgi:hypothetical protein